MRFNHQARGFSLIELLAVMASIAMLTGLVAVAMRAIAVGSRSTVCQSNLRQMAVAAQNYAALYDSWPPAIRYESVNGTLQNIAWDWITAYNQPAKIGALWMFTDRGSEVHQCPAHHGKGGFGEPFTGYNYNTTYIGGESQFPTIGWEHHRRGVPPHACSRSSTCAIFGDGGRKGDTNKYMRAPLDPHVELSTVYSGGQAFRHGHATNVAFIDCHVSSVSQGWQGERATPELLDTYMSFPDNAFLSNDDRMYLPR